MYTPPATKQAILAIVLLLLTVHLSTNIPNPIFPPVCRRQNRLHAALLHALFHAPSDPSAPHIRTIQTLSAHINRLRPNRCRLQLTPRQRRRLSSSPLLSPLLYALALATTPTKTAVEYSTARSISAEPLAPLLHHSWQLASVHANWSSFNAARRFYADYALPSRVRPHVLETAGSIEQTVITAALAGVVDVLADLSGDLDVVSSLRTSALRPRVFASAFAHFWGADVDAVRTDVFGSGASVSLAAVARVAAVAQYRLVLCVPDYAVFVDARLGVADRVLPKVDVAECFAAVALDRETRRDLEARWDVAQGENWTFIGV